MYRQSSKSAGVEAHRSSSSCESSRSRYLCCVVSVVLILLGNLLLINVYSNGYHIWWVKVTVPRAVKLESRGAFKYSISGNSTDIYVMNNTLIPIIGDLSEMGSLHTDSLSDSSHSALSMAYQKDKATTITMMSSPSLDSKKSGTDVPGVTKLLTSSVIHSSQTVRKTNSSHSTPILVKQNRKMITGTPVLPPSSSLPSPSVSKGARTEVSAVTTLPDHRPDCPLFHGVEQKGNFPVQETGITQEMLDKQAASLSKGGLRTVSGCKPRYRVAIIVPFRNRDAQVPIFLHHIHTFLHDQPVDYQVFIVKQVDKSLFNRGMLFNIGFMNARHLDDFNCFIFTDLDLVPIRRGLQYNCDGSPKHMSTYVDNNRLTYLGKPGYHLLNIFGGVVAFTPEHFLAVNGFSNLFFGWGGEDDDLGARCWAKSLHITRLLKDKYMKGAWVQNAEDVSDTGRFHALKHKPHSSQETSVQRFNYLKTSRLRMRYDGLNCLDYEQLSIEPRGVYTLIRAKLSRTNVEAAVKSKKCAGRAIGLPTSVKT